MLRIALIVAALVAAIVPLPSSWVEQWYARGLYPRLQQAVTSASNVVPFAVLDAAALFLIVLSMGWLVRRFRRRGAVRAAVAAVFALVTIAAAVYLAFLLTWGLNYRRTPIEEKVEYEPARITPAALNALVAAAVRQANGLYLASRAPADEGRLREGLDAAARALGASSGPVAGVPKRSALQWYFRRAAIDGMTDPFFLEVILNPEVLPFERPYVLAHEWAHLAGYADESEAGFLAWLACMRADEPARYSAWLAIYGSARSALPADARRAFAQALDSGPRGDLQAIAERHQRSVPAVRRVAETAYDAYLRANRVEEGIRNYHEVVRLVLGAGAANGDLPRLRPR